MNTGFFLDILGFDSTSGGERPLAEHLATVLKAPSIRTFEVGDGTLDLLLSWGTPQVVFCTHIDTVPPYIPPRIDGGRIFGRGTCDAKGQIMAMYSACLRLQEEGATDFGLLLLSGEETGSWGAKAFAKTDFRSDLLVIGEPTENRMVTASKGTKAFRLKFSGEAFHSGYPQYGSSAIDAFIDFVNALRAEDFPDDPTLGATTWNIGRLASDNPQNVLSPELRCSLYFRTTFLSDGTIGDRLQSIACGRSVEVESIGGDSPQKYLTFNGFSAAPVSFGSDAPHLSNFRRKIICGPGSIRFAHRSDEHIDLSDIEAATDNYVRFHHLAKETAGPAATLTDI